MPEATEVATLPQPNTQQIAERLAGLEQYAALKVTNRESLSTANTVMDALKGIIKDGEAEFAEPVSQAFKVHRKMTEWRDKFLAAPKALQTYLRNQADAYIKAEEQAAQRLQQQLDAENLRIAKEAHAARLAVLKAEEDEKDPWDITPAAAAVPVYIAPPPVTISLAPLPQGMSKRAKPAKAVIIGWEEKAHLSDGFRALVKAASTDDRLLEAIMPNQAVLDRWARDRGKTAFESTTPGCEFFQDSGFVKR